MSSIEIVETQKASNETRQQMYTCLFFCITYGTKSNEKFYNNIDSQQLYYNFNLPSNKRKWQDEDGDSDVNGGKY